MKDNMLDDNSSFYITELRDKRILFILDSQLDKYSINDICKSLRYLGNKGIVPILLVDCGEEIEKSFLEVNDEYFDEISSSDDPRKVAINTALRCSKEIYNQLYSSNEIKECCLIDTGICGDKKYIPIRSRSRLQSTIPNGISNIVIDEALLKSFKDSSVIHVIASVFMDKKSKKLHYADSCHFAQEFANIVKVDKLLIVNNNYKEVVSDKGVVSHLSTTEAKYFLKHNNELLPDMKKYLRTVTNFVLFDKNIRRGHIINAGSNEILKELLTDTGAGLMVCSNSYNIKGEERYNDPVSFRDKVEERQNEFINSITRTLDLKNGNFSDIAIKEEALSNEYPKIVACKNNSVAKIISPIPGLLEIESKKGTSDTLVFCCGIHGDEKAGIIINDKLIGEIVSGCLEVNHNIVFIYGNLQAMAANEGKGSRYIEPELGYLSNLNRCFNSGGHNKSYAQKRAANIMESLSILKNCKVKGIDIHQGFRTPSTGEVRGNKDGTFYTYAMLHTDDRAITLKWIHNEYSDIVTGTVLCNLQQPDSTFASYLARTYNAFSATFEMGTIGYIDVSTYTPQLLDNIRSKITGVTFLKTTESFDLWEQVGSIRKKTDDFSFLDENGEKMNSWPPDFIQLPYTKIAQDGDKSITLNNDERLLFANHTVPIGDRAAVIVKLSGQYPDDLALIKP